MQNVENGDFKKRIETELRWCMTFEDGKTCKGAGERKLRQTCIWCPNYMRGERGENEKGN